MTIAIKTSCIPLQSPTISWRKPRTGRTAQKLIRTMTPAPVLSVPRVVAAKRMNTMAVKMMRPIGISRISDCGSKLSGWLITMT
ncbi:MAG TPA: hypothetical protein VFC19_03340 [Candidatus Limnocylindrales bacterium]|nr:hypothetical protein [Candidatus Limnocylindrales bacterium]